MKVFQYYFSNKNQLPRDVGFEIFGNVHVIWLIGILVAVFGFCRLYKNLSREGRGNCQKAVSLSMLLMEIYKDGVLIATGAFSLKNLPLHLCGMAIFIYVIHSFKPNDITSEIIYSLCLPGAFLALLFPTWTAYPVINFIHLHSFILHSLLIIYPLLLVNAGDLVPNSKNLWTSAVFLMGVVPPMYYFNKIFDTNFLFINKPSEINASLIFLERELGNPGYLLGYIAIVLIIWCFLYLPVLLFEYKNDMDLNQM